jgi:uncharacterized membrane protein YhaH (DUF805 family)
MFKGRIGRLAYFLGWVYLLLPILVLLVLILGVSAFTKGAHGGGNPVVALFMILALILDLVWVIFFLVAGFGLIIRRWHDLNQSGWLALLQLIPGVSLVCLIIQLFAPGTNGSNNYGDHAEPSRGFKTVLLGSGSTDSSPVSGSVPQPAAAVPSMPVSPPPIQPQPTPPVPPAPPTPPAPPAPQEPQNPNPPSQ